jgi:hypothetical protein
MLFNEDYCVKTPTLMYLTELGYTYVSLKNAVLRSEKYALESNTIFCLNYPEHLKFAVYIL